MKTIIKTVMSDSTWRLLLELKRYIIRKTRRTAEILGYNISRTSDYYSPLPIESKLERNIHRWNKPSSMAGINYDIASFKKLVNQLMDEFWHEFQKLPDYNKNKLIGFGPGFTELDALILYMMIRKIKPQQYLEVGSGISTYYCCLAAKENSKNYNSARISCIEPYPYEKLYSIPDINVIRDEVQNINKELFLKLEKDDVLFIDSSHVLRIDGDVPFLYLEILPKLKRGVIIHVHDIPFPYNIPYPPENWVLGKSWPMYWNEAMLLQSFLAFNDSYEIIMSTPLIRYYDEQFLRNAIPLYKSIEDEPNTFSSIWLKKVK